METRAYERGGCGWLVTAESVQISCDNEGFILWGALGDGGGGCGGR